MDLAACRRSLVVIVVGLIAAASVLGGWVELIVAADQPPIDFQRARGLLERERRGEKLSTEEQQYLNRAREARRQGMSEGRGQGPITPKDSVGLVPLCDLTGDERYKGEDGGLYGHGQNSPPEAHRRAAEAELARIQPLNAQGQPAKDGKVVLVSISMSNATQEFSVFKRLADADPQKSPLLTIVDCAQGGQAMAEWAERKGGPWTEADRRLAVLHNAKARFPNLRVA
ncbi:MAG: hypothetical protein FJ272_03900, partial [Planctomycetes bacterium]|nr:hypothetical protein [Planctomycetota bacterium]